MDKDTNILIWSFPLVFLVNGQRGGMFRGICPLNSLLILSVLSSVGFSNVPGVEYDWGAQPKLVCMPLPADTDPGCFPPDGVTHGPIINGNNNGHGNGHSNGHGKGHFVGGLPNSPLGGSSRRGMSDEAKATILHLRESLVRQKETILDQRETIRELTAKLTLCEGFGRGASGHHNEDHHGHLGSHHSSHLYDSDRHSDPHYPLNGYHNDHHRGKPPFLGKHAFSPEQAGKTLQALKERLENLQARNSSSTYSSSLKDLLQRKISALEEQLHHHHDSHHDYGNHESHPGQGHRDNHHDDQYGDRHANPDNNRRYGHHYNHYYGHNLDQLSTHNNDNDDHHDDHHNSHNDDHHDDHHDSHLNEHHDDHHSDPHDSGHHSNSDHGHQRRSPLKSTASRARGAYNKLDSVLSHLYHRSPETGNQKRRKNPDGFQIGFPMHTNYMYGRIKHTLLNEIFALTVCLWLKGGSGPGIGTPFSYSVPGQANELVLIEWANSPIELLVNDKAVTLPLSLQDSKWHHICVTWSTRDGVWEAYQNGVKRGSGENLSPWHPIKPGGVFILGQEQDTLGGRFDATQSFVGEMSDLQVWSRVLNSQEIDNQASCSSHLTGDVIAWSESIVELHGGVTKYPFDPCH
ncbi:neuronal pentraxin-1 [Tachysurus fulvidraco]|uniref:neuronal pentraxin-1 n=1 Tax=Tachysurus fulvidraco TaxID=1234273 RepID=UPI001FEF2D72|nr:neuronal pentraxin-1 [Tachysurus fulvidraco]